MYLNIVVEKLGVIIDKLSLSKITRILDIYRKLNNGHLIIKVEEAKRFGVNERSVQRDIDGIRDYISGIAIEHGTVTRLYTINIRKGILI